MMRLQEERAWFKPAFAEEQLQPGAMSSGVREREGNEKGPERTCGWSGHLLLDLIQNWFAKLFGTNFNGHSVYKSDHYSSDCKSFNVLLQDLMPSYGYSQT